ncbi:MULTISPECIES: hypothetical protein [unclassified Sporosarcina]|uniref:hypothetical protein n=1 Tax=unclassified Sporosarcina TaxID=2647733 RepID=UPI002040E300|nr:MULTISPECIES: hypothetical protein [unclassified Sporosarcina]GKV64346.1 hypothetical protein NCCP2331_04990 [Sporosarcina sp. NCCP-2331]GLB55091.1 hypothetical protein NCCP2378_08770 [Sporosarcina sp. NCCP-2378]
MDNKKHPKNLVIVRLVASSLILLSLVLPNLGLMEPSTTPFVILITLFVFFVMENRDGKKTESE